MALSLAELIAQKKQALKGNRQKTVKPPENRSKWRILPGWRMTKTELADVLAGKEVTLEDSQFYHDFGQHFIKDGTGTLKAVYVCVDKTYMKPCEICAALDQAVKSTSDDAMVEMLRQAKANPRILVNALAVDSATPDEPVILELSPTAFSQYLGILADPDIGGPEVLSLNEGRDIIIDRTGKGLQTKYTVQVLTKARKVDPAVMKKVFNLDEYVAQESEEQARRALANLNAIAGMLPAPSAAKPTMADLSVDDVDDAALAAIEGEAHTVTETAAPAPAAKPAAPAAKAAPVAESTGDAELDDLLAELV